MPDGTTSAQMALRDPDVRLMLRDPFRITIDRNFSYGLRSFFWCGLFFLTAQVRRNSLQFPNNFFRNRVPRPCARSSRGGPGNQVSGISRSKIVNAERRVSASASRICASPRPTPWASRLSKNSV